MAKMADSMQLLMGQGSGGIVSYLQVNQKDPKKEANT